MIDSDWLVDQYPSRYGHLPLFLVVGAFEPGQLGRSPPWRWAFAGALGQGDNVFFFAATPNIPAGGAWKRQQNITAIKAPNIPA